jgi:hypothetical protein
MNTASATGQRPSFNRGESVLLQGDCTSKWIGSTLILSRLEIGRERTHHLPVASSMLQERVYGLEANPRCNDDMDFFHARLAHRQRTNSNRSRVSLAAYTSSLAMDAPGSWRNNMCPLLTGPRHKIQDRRAKGRVRTPALETPAGHVGGDVPVLRSWTNLLCA